MAITIQAKKSIVSSLVAITAFFPLSAMALSQCSQADIKVGKRTVGQAVLWMADCRQSWQQQDIRLVFNYSSAIPAWAFKKAANVILARNLSRETWKLNQQAFDQITQKYQPIKVGDVYQLDYQASRQHMTLSLNGVAQGHIQGEISKQYFLIWFGEKPFNMAFKKQLLG